MKSVQKKVDEIMQWPWRNEYRLSVIPEDGGGGIEISIPALGRNLCLGVGDTLEEAEQNLLDALELVIKENLMAGREVPRPRSLEDFSGTFLVRSTPDLHERLVREAEGQGVSLNYLVGILLERALGVGQRQAPREERIRAKASAR